MAAAAPAATTGFKLALAEKTNKDNDIINLKNEDPDPQHQRGKITQVIKGADITITDHGKIGDNIDPPPPADTVYITKAKHGDKYKYYYSYQDAADGNYKWKQLVVETFSRELAAGTKIEIYPKDTGKKPAPIHRRPAPSAPPGGAPPPPPGPPGGAPPPPGPPGGHSASAAAGPPILCEALTVDDLERIFCLRSASTEITNTTKPADNPFNGRITDFLADNADNNALKAKFTQNAEYFKDLYKDADNKPTNVIQAKKYDTVYVCSDIHSDYLALIKLLRDKLFIPADTRLPVPGYDYKTNKYGIYFGTDANGYPTASAHNIYNPDFIAGIKWNPAKKKTLLVITGDLIDGAGGDPETAKHDPFGLFELMVHALIHNLRVSAHKQNTGSDILFTFGNHDIQSLFPIAYKGSRGDKNEFYYFENVSKTVKSLFQLPDKDFSDNYNIRAGLLSYFYMSSPYVYLSIEDNGIPIIACVHATLHHNDDINKYLPVDKPEISQNQTTLLESDFNWSIRNKDFIKSILYPVDTRIYAKELNKDKGAHDTMCTTISNNSAKYQWIVVGHCPTQKGYDADKFFKYIRDDLPKRKDSDRGCSLYACSENTYKTKLGFVDIAISEAFGDHQPTDKTEILRFQRTSEGSSENGYYDKVYRVEHETSSKEENAIEVEVKYPGGTHRGGGSGKPEIPGQIISSRQISSPAVSINLAKHQPLKPNKLGNLRHSLKAPTRTQPANRQHKHKTVKQA